VAKFPEPPGPAQLAAIPPDEVTLSTRTLLWRIYFSRGPYATGWDSFRAFGPTGSRFDHHLDPPRVQERRILYASRDFYTCFAEVFQEPRTIDRNRNEPWLVAFRLQRNLTLLDLSGAWPTKAGASMAINSGTRRRARRWSQVIYSAYSNIEGLLYCSSMDGNKPAVALYERAEPTIPARPAFHRALFDPILFPIVNAAARRFGYRLV